MNEDDVIRWAREAGIEQTMSLSNGARLVLPTTMLTRFAALVAAAERERCAKVCEAMCPNETYSRNYPQSLRCAAAIRNLKDEA